MVKLKVKHLIVIAGVVSTGICISNTNAYATTLGETTKPVQVQSLKTEEGIKSNVIAKENLDVVRENKKLASDVTLSSNKIESKKDLTEKVVEVKPVKNEDVTITSDKAKKIEDEALESKNLEAKKDLTETTNKPEVKENSSEKVEAKKDLNKDSKTDLVKNTENKADLSDKVKTQNNSSEEVENKKDLNEKVENKTDLTKGAKLVKEKEELSKITLNDTTITGDSENGITINLNNNAIGNHVFHINNSHNSTTVMFLNIANDLSYTAHNIYATYCDTYDTATEAYEAREDIKETVEDLTTVAEAVKIIPKDSVSILKDLKPILSEDKQETVKGMVKLGATAVVSTVVCGGTVATVDKMVSAINQIDTVKDEPHSILSPVTKRINHACDVIRTKMYSVRVAVKASKAYVKTKHALVSVKSTISNWFNW